MKATFLMPPVLDGTQDVDRCFGCNYAIYFLPLLPVLYVATLLKDEIERISILDFAAEKKSKNDFARFVKNDDSDIYIFYTVSLCQDTDLAARKMIRESRPGARFIFTGPQATHAPEIFLDNPDTFAVRGEPEFTTRDLVRALKSGSSLNRIAGLSYLKDLKIIHNPARGLLMNLDEIPIPDRALLDHRPYYNPKLHKSPHTATYTSRGCFGKCWYCVPGSLAYATELEYKKCFGVKPPPRLHSASRVIKEFENIKELGFKSVSIIDDEFIWNEKRVIEICEGIKDLKLEWFCLTRPDTITEGSARAMAEAGCSYVDLGTESFDQDVLTSIGKNMSPEDTVRAVRILKDYGINPEINVLLAATPKETEATIRKTIREIEKLDVDYVLYSIANPFPGTDFYKAAKENNWLVYGDYRPVDPARESIIAYPHLSKKKLEQLASYAYMKHYFNPRYIVKQILALRSFKDFTNKLSTAFGFVRRNFL